MIPAVLFASRLAMVEVVLHTCEFQGLLYVFFTILSVDLFVRSRKSESSWPLTLSALAFCLALLSKELAIVLPALLIVYQPVVKVGDDSMDRQNGLAVLNCRAWQCEPDRVSKRRCGSRPRSRRSLRGIRSTRG